MKLIEKPSAEDLLISVRSEQCGGQECDIFYVHTLSGEIEGMTVNLRVSSHWSDAARGSAHVLLCAMAEKVGLAIYEPWKKGR